MRQGPCRAKAPSGWTQFAAEAQRGEQSSAYRLEGARSDQSSHPVSSPPTTLAHRRPSRPPQFPPEFQGAQIHGWRISAGFDRVRDRIGRRATEQFPTRAPGEEARGASNVPCVTRVKKRTGPLRSSSRSTGAKLGDRKYQTRSRNVNATLPAGTGSTEKTRPGSGARTRVSTVIHNPEVGGDPEIEESARSQKNTRESPRCAPQPEGARELPGPGTTRFPSSSGNPSTGSNLSIEERRAE